MNESYLNSPFSIDISASENIFDVFNRPNLKVRLIFSEFVLLNSQMVCFLIEKRRNKNQLIVYDAKLPSSDGKSINQMNFLER
jgi:hypothetical protein